MRQHQVVRANRRLMHLAFDRVDADALDVRGPWRAERCCRGELVFALVDPVDRDIECRKHARDRAPDMTRAVELQMKQR